VKEDFLEEIKKAISSTVKAIAENKDLEVVFEDNQFPSVNKVVLPKIDNQEDINSLSELRGSADNQALMYKYHDKNLFN
jgi:cobalamin biosynthesis protein CobT